MRYMLFTRLLERAINLRGNRAMAAQLKLIDSEDKKGNMDRQKALEAALSQIDRAFGKGSAMKLGSRDKMEIEAVSTGSLRSEEHTSELQSLMRISYAVFCLKKKK